MSKIMQLYGMTPDEALRISDSQVQTMLDHAQNSAIELLQSTPSFQAALTTQLAPVKRAVRALIET